MNRRSHRIRKLKKPFQKVEDQYFEQETFQERLISDSTSDKETVLVLLQNLNNSISNNLFQQIVSAELIEYLVARLQDKQQQIVQCANFAIINIIQIAKTKEQVLIVLGMLFKKGILDVMINQINNLNRNGNQTVFNASTNQDCQYIISSFLQLSENLVEYIPQEHNQLIVDSQFIDAIVSVFLGFQQNEQLVYDVLNVLNIVTHKMDKANAVLYGKQELIEQMFKIHSQNNFHKMNLQIKTLVMQILFNIYCCPDNNGKEGYQQSVSKIELMVIESVQEIISINLFEEINNLIQILSKDQYFQDKLGDQSQLVLQIWEDSALGILNTLDFINRILAIDCGDNNDDQFEDHNLDDSWESDQNIPENKQIDIQQQYNKKNQFEKGVIEKITNQYLVKLLFDKTQILNDNQLKFIKDYEQSIGLIYDYSQEIVQESTNIYLNLFNNYNQAMNNQNIQVQQILEHLFTNISRTLSINQFANIIIDQLKLFQVLLKNNQSLIVQFDKQQLINLFKKVIELDDDKQIAVCIDILVLVFGPFKQMQQFNEQVAQILLNLMQNNNLYVNSLAINGIFDLYSENDYDQVYNQMAINSILKKVVDPYKTKIKQCTDKEHKPFFNETLLNLKRFIKYKQ